MISTPSIKRIVCALGVGSTPSLVHIHFSAASTFCRSSTDASVTSGKVQGSSCFLAAPRIQVRCTVSGIAAALAPLLWGVASEWIAGKPCGRRRRRGAASLEKEPGDMDLAARLNDRAKPESDSDDASVRGDEGSLADRRMSEEEWDRGRGEIEERGLPVRLILDDPPEDPEAYDPDHREWVEDDNHRDGGYFRNNRELLRVRLRPLEGFAKMSNRKRRRGEPSYHVALCYTDELHRFDLYDRRHGVQLGLAAYKTLRARYQGRTAVLMGRVRGTSLELTGRTRAEGLERHNLVRDNDLRALRDCGTYAGQRLRVRL